MSQTILVVDDEPNLVDLIRMTLERENYQVIEADNGYKAIQRLREELPDLVLLDIILPGRSGLEILSDIKAAHPGIKVVVITAVVQKVLSR